MNEPTRTYEELLEEVSQLKQRIGELEESEALLRLGEKELTKSEAKFKEIFETIEDLYYETDSRGIVTMLSPSVSRLTGWAEDDLIGKPTTMTYADPADRGQLLSKISEKGYVHDYELLLKRKDGEVRQASLSARFILDESGRPAGLRGLIRDITQRKRTEEALRQSESRLSSIIEFLPDATFAIDMEGKVIAWNKAIEEMTGFSAEDMLGKGNYEHAMPFYRERRPILLDLLFIWDDHIAEKYAFIKKTGDTLYTETDVPCVMGKKKILWGKASLLRNEKGDIIGAIESIRDITGPRKAEEALRRTEEKYRSIFENAIEGIFRTTPEGRYMSANPALARIFGYDSPEEMIDIITDIGKEQYVDPEDRKRLKGLLERHGFVEKFEAPIFRRDGGEVWVSMTARAIRGDHGEIAYYEGYAEDITSRKKVDEELRTAHQRVLDIIEFLPDATAVIDRDRKVVAWNRAMEEMTGVKKEYMLGKGDYVYAVPFYGERRPVLMDLALDRDTESLQKYDYIEKQGNVLLTEVHAPKLYGGKGAYLSARASSLFDPAGNIVGAIESVRDITGQKRITKELQESEERYRTAIENSGDGVVMIKGEEHVYVNKKYLEIFGFDRADQVLGQHVAFVIHPDDRERVAEISRRRQRYEKAPSQYEVKTIRATGDVLHVEISATLITYKGEIMTLAYVRDVTARKHLEAQLLQSQKMEAIGTLAGGVAHDFNNMLTAIIGYGSLLQMGMGNDPRRQYVDQILASSQKAAVLTQSLLAFSRKQAIELKPREINHIVGEAEKLLNRLLTEDIEFTVIRADADMTVAADVTQIDQVLMNLAANARDAMPRGGRLTIRVEPFSLDHGFVADHGFGEPGDYALISVSDTGMGMDEQTKEKIFEPFFTTKEVGKGTGLGLSIAYGIIKQHNGYITVSSEPLKGTAFHVYLPVVRTATERVEASHEQIRGGNETILVAEDNDEVRGLATAVLRAHGYSIVEATDGESAVRQFMGRRDEIALLFLDVVMPGKNGKEAYEEMRRVKPDVRVLFTSGYTGDVVLTKGVSDETIDYVSKPLTPKELLKKVREVLDR